MVSMDGWIGWVVNWRVGILVSDGYSFDGMV